MNEALSLALRALTLAVTVVRPRRAPEAAVAAAGAALLVVGGRLDVDAEVAAGAGALALAVPAPEGTADAPRLREFTRIGLITVPPAILLATAALWLGLRVTGG